MDELYNVLDISLDLLVDLKMNPDYKEEISKPKGPIIRNIKDISGFLITVGDRVSLEAISKGLNPDVIVVDLVEKRSTVNYRERLFKGRLTLSAFNPAGTITKEAWIAVRASIDLARMGLKTALLVQGEEDLLGFPAAIFAPLDSILIYGQPDEGAVIVKIKEDVKREALDLLLRGFSPFSR